MFNPSFNCRLLLPRRSQLVLQFKNPLKSPQPRQQHAPFLPSTLLLGTCHAMRLNPYIVWVRSRVIFVDSRSEECHCNCCRLLLLPPNQKRHAATFPAIFALYANGHTTTCLTRHRRRYQPSADLRTACQHEHPPVTRHRWLVPRHAWLGAGCVPCTPYGYTHTHILYICSAAPHAFVLPGMVYR